MRVKMSNYTVAYCPDCKGDQAIYANGITPCSGCGRLLFPCSACQECLYEACPYDGKTDKELEVYINKPVPKEVANRVIRRFKRQFTRRIQLVKWRRWWKEKFQKKDSEWLPF